MLGSKVHFQSAHHMLLDNIHIPCQWFNDSQIMQQLRQ